MTDFPTPDLAGATPTHIGTSYVEYGVAWREVGSVSAPTAGTWVANLAAYIPFSLYHPYPVFRVFWVTGSTVSSTNVDMGIYTTDGTLLYSTGSTAMGSASTVQYVTVATPFILTPGQYYLAWTCSNTTNRMYGPAITASIGVLTGCLQQATALPLPATATFAVWAQTVIPYCGITRTSSGF